MFSTTCVVPTGFCGRRISSFCTRTIRLLQMDVLLDNQSYWELLNSALPALAGVGWIVGLHGRTLVNGWVVGLRDAVLLAGLLLALIAVAACWIGSVTGALASTFFICWWLGWAVLGGLAAWNARHERMKPLKSKRTAFGSDEWLLAGALSLVVAAAFLMAVLSPPNNADSLIYHLPRQVFWMAQGTVFTDQVSNPHMIKMPPLSEYLGLNLYLLTGSDRVHNLIQWVALCGCLVAISRILCLAGGSRRAQFVGCLFFATLPAVFFEASNTKNDLVTTFFLLGAVWALTGAVLRRRFVIFDAVLAGLFAGCALLTKGTAIAFLPVIGAVFLAVSLRMRVPLSIHGILVAVVLTTAVAAPHFVAQSSRILNSERGSSSNHANAIMHPAAGLAVLIQNAALQFALPFDSWNRSLEGGVGQISAAVGFPVNDERTTFAGTRFGVAWHPEHEDRATGLIHWAMLLLIPVFGWLWVKPPLRSPMLIFGISAILLFVVFSLLFRWQPWHSRLLIPCVAIGSIGVGLAVPTAGRWFGVALAVAWCAWLWPSLDNTHRPLIGPRSLLLMRDEQILRNIDVPADVEASRNSRVIFGKIDPSSVGVHFPSGGIVYSLLRSLQRADGTWPQVVLLGDGNPDVWLVKSVNPTARPDFVVSDWQSISLGGAWALWMSPAKAESASALIDPAAFDWPGEMRGVGDVQGPYPEYRLAAFRNLYAPQAVFESGPTDLPMTLRMIVGSFGGPNRLTIRIGDQRLGELEVKNDAEPAEFRAIVPAQSAAFSIIVDFTMGYPSDYDPGPVAARLFRINFTPIPKTP